MNKYIALIAALALIATGCYKPMDTEANPIPGNTLVLEFAAPVRYVMDLSIDGEPVPIRFIKKNRILWVEGLPEGVHTFNIHSISYVFGPEFQKFKVDANRGAYFFIQQRKYRSGLPKAREQVSIRAYRRKLRKEGVDVKKGVEIGKTGSGPIKAYFTAR
ncbi:MAG: hypothetical protein QNK37_18315 [Acidobacteriota bacterium]|nr:hypothetical protein [Acidobacteriota bacterium]